MLTDPPRIPPAQHHRTYLGHKDCVYTLASGPEGTFFSAGADGLVAQWALGSEAPAQGVLQAPQPLYSLLYLPSLQVLVCGQNDGGLHWVHLPTRQLLRSSRVHTDAVFDLLAGPGPGQLLAASRDGTLSLWDAAAGHCLLTAQVNPLAGLRSLALHPHQPWLAVAGQGGWVRIYSTQDLSPLACWQAHADTVFRVAWAPGGQHLLTTGRDAHLRLWHLPQVPEGTPVQLPAVAAHLMTVNDAQWLPGTPWLATASMDKTIKIWRAQLQHPQGPDYGLRLHKVLDRRRHPAHSSSVNRVLWAPLPPEVHDPAWPQHLLSAADDRAVLGWRLGLDL